MCFFFSVAKNQLGPKGAKYLADALNVNTSPMKKLTIFGDNLGDEGIGIITSAIEGKEISLCGAEPGQTGLDLSNRGLGPEDAKLIAWELTTGFVSTSMTKLKVNNCELPIDILKNGTEVDLSGQSLGVLDAIIIAGCINVSASMTKMNVLSNSIGDEGYEILTKVAEEKGILTLVGFDEGQTEADLSNKGLRPIDAKLIARELTTGFVSTSLKSLK